MNEAPKYDRANLMTLLSERLAFERTAVRLYDAALEKLQASGDEDVMKVVPTMQGYRDQEEEHANWIEAQMQKLGHVPRTTPLTQAVQRESRGMEQVIAGRDDGLLPVLHALYGVELMDNAGWDVLLQVAQQAGDDNALIELNERVEHEKQHLDLIRTCMLEFTKKSVLLDDTGPPTRKGGTKALGRGARGQSRTASTPAGKAPAKARGGGKARGGETIGGGARTTTDHEEIRRWVEERGGSPSCVRKTGGTNDPGILRIDFPGYSGEKSLQPMAWDDWFEAFDANGLAFLHQDMTASGEVSRFNKLVARDGAANGSSATARGRGAPRGGNRPQARAPKATGGKRGASRGRASPSR
jgi:rubrerythrin